MSNLGRPIDMVVTIVRDDGAAVDVVCTTINMIARTINGPGRTVLYDGWDIELDSIEDPAFFPPSIALQNLTIVAAEYTFTECMLMGWARQPRQRIVRLDLFAKELRPLKQADAGRRMLT